ncbi:hypothetical protein ACFPRA_00820 [Sporosarcina soli]|uniref:DUF7683 domain-containing protein n=1 Tax=Sporosarcina soli TaxID=334736 RepID=A0ABW0TDT8_9BACL
MVTSINYQWRITKYNPDFRDDDGYYTIVEEWTCPSQIGQTINGHEFTLNEYLRVEASYVDTVIQFLVASNLSSLRILQCSTVKISPEERQSILYEPAFDEVQVAVDRIVTIQEIRIICQMVLRNLLFCQFYLKDQFFVHFGWDSYMYVGSCNNSLSAIAFAENNGLFVEPFQSPYYYTEEKTTRLVEWNEITDDSKLIVGSEELIEVPIEEYQRVLKLSNEHPVIGQFNLSIEHKEFFQKLLKHEMDFTKYEYFFTGEH